MSDNIKKTANKTVLDEYARMILKAVNSSNNSAAKILDINVGLKNIDNVKASVVTTSPELLTDFSENSFDAITIKEQLYKSTNPIAFFQDASNLLKPGGKLILIEPAVSLASWAYYKYSSNYELDMSANPFVLTQDVPFQDAPRLNIAIPTILFTRQEHRIQFMERFPDLRMLKRQWVGAIADPLSCSKKPYSLIPAVIVPLVFEIENLLNPFLGRWLSTKMMVVFQKSN